MLLDIITMGEMLIDFVPMKKGVPLKENEGFLRMPGGAPANVAVGASKLGCSTAFFGKVGKDPFGDLLLDTLNDNLVDTTALIQTDEAKTSLAFVTLDESGDRDFTFYRDPGADMLYRWEEVNQELFHQTKIFHHGSISLINEPVRDTTLKMAEEARKSGILVSYDPNLRLPLWSSEDQARHWIIEGLKTADIVKISEEELSFITGKQNFDNGVKDILEYGVKLLFVTKGAAGSYYNNLVINGSVAGFSIEVQDTTGAGDGFTAGILSMIIKKGIQNLRELNEAQFQELVRFANAVGALTTTGKGAISSLPDFKRVEDFILDFRES